MINKKTEGIFFLSSFFFLKGRDMKSFLGLTNIFREHIKNYAEKEKPLRDMILDYNKTRSKVLTWTRETEEAFTNMQYEINECTPLFFYDQKSPVHIYTDASDLGWGVYICQITSEGVEQPIGFASRTFNPQQLRWSVPEREAYGVYAGIEHYKYLIRDVPFTLHTDHKNLTYIKDSGSSKVIRWKLDLMEYDYDLVHIPGHLNHTADFMSRNENGEQEETVDCDVRVGSAARYLASMVDGAVDQYDQRDQEYLAATVEKYNTIDREYLAANATFVDIPDHAYEILKKVHNAIVGHHGLEKTMDKLRKQGHDWKYMRPHAKKFIQECDCCQKMSYRDFAVTTAPYTTGGFLPFERVNVDCIGPFVEDENGYTHAVVIEDTMSRFIDVYPVRATNKENIADSLLQHVGRFGTPSQVLTDGGPEFNNEVMYELADLLDLEHILTLAGSKQENSIVERGNLEIGRWVRELIYEKRKGDKTQWAKLIPYAVRLHNASVVQDIGCSPAQIVFGTSIDLDREILIKRVMDKEGDEPITEWLAHQNSIQKDIIKIAQKKQEQHREKHTYGKMKENSKKELTEYKVDDLVLVAHQVNRFNPNGRPTKFDSIYRGPYKVLGHEGHKYYLNNLATGRDEPAKSIHLLKPFYYDAKRTDPVDIALKDYQDRYLVEAVLDHKGNFQKKIRKVQFKIKWLGWEEPTWEPWSNVRLNEEVHEYLKKHNLQRYIPKILTRHEQYEDA
jgi:hypothetical protein